jgi:purine-binding chemotaxis protein CheW
MSIGYWNSVQTESEKNAISENQVNLACFEADGRIYALDVSQVREIVRHQEATPLPMAPTLIEGVIDLRGAVIPVIDLGRLLGGACTVANALARIVILDFDGLVVGLAVQGATDVLSLDVSDLEDVPDLAAHTGYDAVRHVIRRAGEAPVMMLSLENIIERVYRSAIRQQGEPLREGSFQGEAQ